jgi:hypothetical protein
MMAVVAVVALLIAVALSLVLGDGKATVEFVNKTNIPIEAVVIDYPGGQIRSRNLAPGNAVRGKAEAMKVGSDRSFDIKFRVSVARSGKDVRVWNPGASFSPYHHEPYVRYELVEAANGQAELTSQGFGERPTPG